MISWLVFIIIGKLSVFLGQKFPLPNFLERNKKIKEWHECSLCFGVWIYALLALFLHMDILSVLGFSYVPVVSELLTGGVISFLVFIFSVGWKDYFSPDIVIGE
jgi:hypothetical protein